MIVLEEVLVVNVIAVVMMLFLLRYYWENEKRYHADDRVFFAMAIIVIVGAVAEIVSYLIDGQDVACGRLINYASNTLSFAGTVSVGFLWCIYVDLHVHKNYSKSQENAKIAMVPWVVEIAVLFLNLFDTDIMFSISADNVYARGPFVAMGYVTLLIYFAYSILLARGSKKQSVQENFFPVQYFLAPCLVGVVAQFIWYGITTSWISVAIAMLFVQMQADSENLLTDALSGIYNRRYLNRVLNKVEANKAKSLYGIMMDINDFKEINDKHGHNKGDRAICVMGDILLDSIPDGGIPIRYAGDEFVVLLADVEQDCVDQTIENIEKHIRRFNESGTEPFTLSLAIGQTKLGATDDAESFLSHMDEKMYEEKRKYHQS